MSWQATSAVAKQSKAKGSDRLVLLCIANYAQYEDERVAVAWPSIASLCEDTLLSERAVRYILRRLQKSGELDVETGKAIGGKNRYRILLPALPSGGRKPRERGAKFAPAGSANVGY